MILLTSDNEYSLGLAKLVLRKHKLYYEYDTCGYKIARKDFKKVSACLNKILSLEFKVVS